MSLSTAGPAHRVQSAAVEYGYPQGHLGHLSTQEEEAFKNFKLLCEEKGVYKPGTEHEAGTHDDATLLRFLRARRFIIGDAFKQFEDTEKWRKANELDRLYETIDLDHYEETRLLYPQWTGRRDRRGIPVYVYEVKHLNSKRMAAYEKSAKETHTHAHTDGKTSPKLLRLFALYENLIRFTMPLCTALKDRDNPSTPITQSNNIVDISGVGLKQFWNLRTHMQDASTLATAHYPETLDRIFIIGAPSFFPTVWGWIKKWFDPITTSKIFIISSQDMKKTLESFIDPVNIPKKYGGELNFEFGSMPVLDPALKDVLTWEGDIQDFPTGPMYWVNDKGRSDGGMGGGKMQAISAGSIENQERKVTVCTVTKAHVQSTSDINGHSGTMETGIVTEPDLETPAPASTTAAPVVVVEDTSAGKANDESQGIAVHNETPPNAEVIDRVEHKVIEEGKIVPASRPEPVSFVTASEGLGTLSLQEKSENTISTEGPHTTTTANLLDSNVGSGTAETSVTKESTSVVNENKVLAESGGETTNNVPHAGAVIDEKHHEHKNSLARKIAHKVGL